MEAVSKSISYFGLGWVSMLVAEVRSPRFGILPGRHVEDDRILQSMSGELPSG